MWNALWIGYLTGYLEVLVVSSFPLHQSAAGRVLVEALLGMWDQSCVVENQNTHSPTMAILRDSWRLPTSESDKAGWGLHKKFCGEGSA